MSKKITLLGSTGSIGTQSLDVIRAQGYEVYGLSAHSHVEKILQQIEEFHPKYVCMTDPDAAAKLDAALAGRANAPKLLTVPEGLKELAALEEKYGQAAVDESIGLLRVEDFILDNATVEEKVSAGDTQGVNGDDPSSDGSSAEGTVDEELEAAEATDMVPEDGEADQDADSSTSDAAGQE